MSTAAERVSAGAEMLDALEPGWRDRINVETFDIYSTTECVMGQLSNGDGYNAGVAYYGLDGDTAREYGFDLTYAEYRSEREPEYWQALQDAWMAEITKPTGKFASTCITSNRDGIIQVSRHDSPSDTKVFKESQLMFAADGTWLMVDYCAGSDWASWYVNESK